MSDTPSVIELGADRYAEWNAFLEGAIGTSIYSRPDYLDVLCGAAGGRFRIVAASRDGQIVGGVALYECESMFGRFVAPRLLLYYNGLVLRKFDTHYPSQQTSRNIATQDALASWISGLGLGSVNLRNLSDVTDVRPFLARGWDASPGYSYRVDLSDLPGQWSRVEHNLRRLVQRCATREALSFTDDSDFESFHRLHLLTLRRHHAPPYLPEAAFRRYFDQLQARGLARLFHARLPDGQSIASELVLLGPGGTSHTVAAGGDPACLNMGAHAFLRWRSFEALAGRGCVSNDLTDATLNAVTHFKSQLGGQLVVNLVLQSPKQFAYALGTKTSHKLHGLRHRLADAARHVLQGASA